MFCCVISLANSKTLLLYDHPSSSCLTHTETISVWGVWNGNYLLFSYLSHIDSHAILSLFVLDSSLIQLVTMPSQHLPNISFLRFLPLLSYCYPDKILVLCHCFIRKNCSNVKCLHKQSGSFFFTGFLNFHSMHQKELDWPCVLCTPVELINPYWQLVRLAYRMELTWNNIYIYF